jgi:peptide/nickel transport system permease protein
VECPRPGLHFIGERIMIGFILRRILAVIPTLLGVTVVIFLMLAITPGDPAELLLGERATPESLDAMRDYLGLKEPLYVQYGLFLKRVAKFDLGETIWTREKVSEEIKARFPATIELAVAAMLISSFFGIILGLISATRQYSWFDYISMVGSLIGVSMPVFWLALVLMLLFSLTLGWFPMSGRLSVDTELTVITNFYLLDSILTGNWEAFWDALRHLALPAIALSTIPLAIVARMTRSSMLEVFRQDYIKTARAKGLSEFKIVMKHALRNGLIPVITVVGLQFGILMGGAILTETVFAWPGVGKWLFDGVVKRDYMVIQGGTLLVATTFVLVNLVVDVLYAVINPRISVR